MVLDNSIHIKIQTFNKLHETEEEIGRYENVLIADLDVDSVLKDLKKAYAKVVKRLEIDLNNFKRGIN